MKGSIHAALMVVIVCVASLLIVSEAMAQGDAWYSVPSQTPLIETTSYQYGQVSTNWQTGEIVVEGIGVAEPRPGESIASMKYKATMAARRVAQAIFMEYVQGVIVRWTSNVITGHLAAEQISTEAQGLVQGLRSVKGPEIEVEQDGSITAHIWMSQSLKNVGNVTYNYIYDQYQNNRNIIKKAPDYPRDTVEPSKTTYTGLIVDCRGMSVRPSLTPRIIDTDEREIYGSLKVKKLWLLNYGLVGYEPSVEAAKKQEKKRVGDNPLVVKPQMIVGTNQDVVVLDNDVAAKVVSADKATGFLNRAKVVFVLD